MHALRRPSGNVAPFFGAFVLREIAPGQTQLLWKDRYSDIVFYPYQLSDGTVRYICLATLLLQPEPASTLIVDEPELGLHPYAIKLLASMLHEAAQGTQLIISTQSSLLIDGIEPGGCHCRKSAGRTNGAGTSRFRPARRVVAGVYARPVVGEERAGRPTLMAWRRSIYCRRPDGTEVRGRSTEAVLGELLAGRAVARSADES